MNKIKRWMAAAMAVALLGVVPVEALAQQATGPRVGPAGAYYYNWQVVDEAGFPFTGQDVNCTVTQPQIHGYVTLHANSSLDDKTGGGTIYSDDNGKFHFYTSLAGPFDVQCYYAGGGGATVRLRHTDHKIVVPRQGRQIARFAVSTSSATYQSDSGIVIPAGSIIEDVAIRNMNPRALGTYHLSVGFLGNHSVATADALAAAQALTSAEEWLRAHSAITATGVSPTHRGVVLRTTHGAATGAYAEIKYMVSAPSGLQVSYSAQPGVIGAAGANFVVAHVYVIYQRLHSVSNKTGFGLGN